MKHARLSLCLLIIVIAGFFFVKALCRPPDLPADPSSSAIETTQVKNEQTLTKKDPEASIKLAGVEAGLFEFNPTDYTKALATDQLVVLYFYANWCPSCRREFKELIAIFNEFTTEKVIGFRVNFKDSDTNADEEAIARQFGVAYQHTKVLIKNGKQVVKAPDSWDHERYEKEIYQWLE